MTALERLAPQVLIRCVGDSGITGAEVGGGNTVLGEEGDVGPTEFGPYR